VNGRENCSFSVALHSGTSESRRYEAFSLIATTGKAMRKTTGKTTSWAAQRKMICRATQRRTMLKTSMIKIILPQPAILPRMTRSTTRAAAAASDLGIIHHVSAAKAAKPNDAMDPEVRINAINKEVRGLINRRAFSLVHVNAMHSHANIIGTRNSTRLKHFDTIDEETKARLTIQGCQDAGKNQIVSNAPTVSHASICILIRFAAIKVYPV
jgi:hypothetical protein